MIDLEPNDELSLVRDTARKFAADHLVGDRLEIRQPGSAGACVV